MRTRLSGSLEDMGLVDLLQTFEVDAANRCDTRELLGRITAPVLIVNGTRDRIVPMKITRELARGILRCCWPGRWGRLWECGRLLREGWREQWMTRGLLLRLAGCCLAPLSPGRPSRDPGGSGKAGGKRR